MKKVLVALLLTALMLVAGCSTSGSAEIGDTYLRIGQPVQAGK